MKRLFRLLLALAFLAAIISGTWGIRQQRQLEFQLRRVALLEAENARLRARSADVTKRDETGIRTGIEQAVADIRQLSFLAPVDYNVLSRSEIKATLHRKLGEQFSDQEFANVGIGYSALGLLPKNFPLKQKYVDLLGEQVAAFFDQHEHKLFMFEDATLTNAQNRIVLAHELTHALQDQHFGLRTLPLEIKNNDDVALAASALVEGDATLVMSDYMLRNISWRTVRDGLSGLLVQNMEQLQQAPPFLREMLLFPYLRGQEFCAALMDRGGYSAISAAYSRPPSSTAQILHPAKYFAVPREEPISITWPDTEARGEKPLSDNVLGEFGTRVALANSMDPRRAEAAAAGWRGDRYLVFDHGNAFVWKSLWSDGQEAGEFKAALLEWINDLKTSRPLWKFFIHASAENGVVLIAAFDEQWIEALTAKFAQ
jgi:hypothetical protein